ncbi:helix-turn-helix transcriptional regulator [Pseudodesulfovibrio indicus]|uniref:helix-turn-helix domain-containing protein n=1 Tax=Pseudodesulfovibrio indicus TaxID=1716143 RepID=UPI002931109E|nr:helix-turn-helix transcriptional regulator [Pseudodesulfovibrio indicus]
MNAKKRLAEVMPHKALRGFRLREGLSRTDLADRLGIPADLIAEWEAGEPVPVPLAIQLAAILNTDPLCLLRPQTIDRQELKRLARIFRDASANLAIEGMRMSKKEQARAWAMYRVGLSSDDAVLIIKHDMGLKV